LKNYGDPALAYKQSQVQKLCNEFLIRNGKPLNEEQKRKRKEKRKKAKRKQILQPIAGESEDEEEEEEHPALIKWEMEWWRKVLLFSMLLCSLLSSMYIVDFLA
jgi:uncharacterized membrane protein YcjF (UPF0283 family)